MEFQLLKGYLEGVDTRKRIRRAARPGERPGPRRDADRVLSLTVIG
jgi:hypothetical protein